jgi:hypothetical protein
MIKKLLFWIVVGLFLIIQTQIWLGYREPMPTLSILLLVVVGTAFLFPIPAALIAYFRTPENKRHKHPPIEESMESNGTNISFFQSFPDGNGAGVPLLVTMPCHETYCFAVRKESFLDRWAKKSLTTCIAGGMRKAPKRGLIVKI